MNEYEVVYPNGKKFFFDSEEKAREFMDDENVMKENGRPPQLRLINPSDSDVGEGDGRLKS